MKLKVLLGIVIATCFFLWFYSVHNVRLIGKQLLTIPPITDWSSNHNNPVQGIVNIGPGLYNALNTRTTPIEKIKVKGMMCDCFGDSFKVTHSIVMASDKGQLCIRLRFDPFLWKYHVVGYSGSIE